LDIEETSNSEFESADNLEHHRGEVPSSTEVHESSPSSEEAEAENDSDFDGQSSETIQDQPEELDSGSKSKQWLISSLVSLVIGLVIGALISGVAVVRTQSSQMSLASKLIAKDHCGPNTTSPSGFCFNSPVAVSYNPSNPLNQLLAEPGTVTIDATQSRIGLFGNSHVTLKLTGLKGSSASTILSSTSQRVTATLAMQYTQLTKTLQSGSSNGASIFYAGKSGEIATSNNISYQGKIIPLKVISKIDLKNNQLYLTPLTVSALGNTAPASSVFSNVSPVPVTIPTLPKGLNYQSIQTTKNELIFVISGNHVPLANLFSAK
jgi:hypothetical protein